jgi:hypothetical protein
MYRWDIINLLIRKYDYRTYLEIGVQNKNCFNKVNCNYKISVDPDQATDADFNITSDEYFEKLSSKVKFDIIFIDGLHHDDQLLTDIKNSLLHLNEGGTIVCHDILPTTEAMQQRADNGGEWTGDVWKAIANLRVNDTSLQIHTIDTDYGCAVIQRGHGNFLYNTNNNDYLTYEYYSKHKNEMLNVISPTQFIELYKL